MRIHGNLKAPSMRKVPGSISHHALHASSRRAFFGKAAGAALGAGLLASRRGLAAPGSAAPRPTTNTISLGGETFSLVFFGIGLDPSVITDFNGFVGVADVQGAGTAMNPDGSKEKLLFDTDMRFMSGAYVGQDGEVHKGTFGFV